MKKKYISATLRVCKLDNHVICTSGDPAVIDVTDETANPSYEVL